MANHLLGVGTMKGLYLFDHDRDGTFTPREPLLPEWEITALLLDPSDADHMLVGTSHYAWGPTLRETRDGGKTWSQTPLRKHVGGEPRHPLKAIWQLTRSPDGQTLYAGVDEAALYKSGDGENWEEVKALADHPSRPHWNPGAGGLCLHTILIDPSDADRMWVGISAVGVFGTSDGGETWQPMNKGIPPMVQTGSPDEDAAYCIHKMQLDPTTPNRLLMQFHAHSMTPDGKPSSGVLASDDGAQTWRAIDGGLECKFGFPLGVSAKGEVFVVPLKGDFDRTFAGGEPAVCRTDDLGQTWHRTPLGGETPDVTGVLRDAMAVDRGDPAGVYLGTTNGDVFASLDAGASYAKLPGRYPRVLVVRSESFDA